MTTYVSAIKPSGIPHLGNYFGAIAPHIEIIQNLGQGDKFYLFIADYHALTTLSDAKLLKSYTKQVAATYLALGKIKRYDADVMFFRQSDVPQVTELMFLLATCTGVGTLQRCHAYKAAVANGHKPNAGLFTYPVLMAADILIYGADSVPVGEDQVQHINLAQDMASSFNARFKTDVLKRPEPEVSPIPKVLGLDGRKMSKSYNNVIPIFAEGRALDYLVASIVTDSRSPSESKDPDSVNVFKLLELFLPEEEAAEMRKLISEGGKPAPGYGDLKKKLVSRMDECFGEAREDYRKLMETSAGNDEIESYFVKSGGRARFTAMGMIDKCYEACGIPARRSFYTRGANEAV